MECGKLFSIIMALRERKTGLVMGKGSGSVEPTAM